MKKILIFSGTTEGRTLASLLCQRKMPCTVCVATSYGEWVMEKTQYLTIHQGRMDAGEIAGMVHSGEYSAVVDATHPYAGVITENIKAGIEDSGIPYYRLKRSTNVENKLDGTLLSFEDSIACIRFLNETTGNILLTTGSKELPVFAHNIRNPNRLFVRVLPSLESISICNQNGIRGKQIIAMQGPFGKALNQSLINQFQIQYLVTKESGREGGFPEKWEAAKEEGIKTLVIHNPDQKEGWSLEEILHQLQISQGSQGEEREMHISLIGMGMGGKGLLTQEAREELSQAEMIFGPERWLLPYRDSSVKKLPYYLATDILPYLKQQRCYQRIAVLFSGDTGFYSGAASLYRELKKAVEKKEIKAQVKLCPGISSVSYLASRIGTDWQDSKIISLHGQEFGEREQEILNSVRENKKTFLLFSGCEDIKQLGRSLMWAGLLHIRITLGYQLSYKEEEISPITPEDCRNVFKEGLYCCFLENLQAEERIVLPGIRDREFIRGNVPMTKEEIRVLAVCKLKLTEHSVVYDIGGGTGSVSVECARLSGRIRVFSIECKKEAVRLIQENAEKFNLKNIYCVEDMAPKAFQDLPAPTQAFLGGTKGNMKEILEKLYVKNPCLRIVIHGVTLETIGKITALLSCMPVRNEEIIQVQISRGEQRGCYHLMQGENPVFMAAFDFVPSSEPEIERKKLE